MGTLTPRRLYDPSRLLAVAKAMPSDAGTTRELQAVVDDLAAALPGATVAVNLAWTDILFILAAHNMPEWIREAGGMPIDWAPCLFVVDHDEALLIADTHDDPEHVHNPVVTVCGVRSYIGVPLRDRGGELVGTLVALHTAPAAFTETDLGLLTTVAPRATALLPGAPAPECRG